MIARKKHTNTFMLKRINRAFKALILSYELMTAELLAATTNLNGAFGPRCINHMRLVRVGVGHKSNFSITIIFR